MTITVEKGIPIPKSSVGRPNRYPWVELEVGDSFFVDAKSKRGFQTQIYSAGRRFNRKFALREVGEGVRVWRIE